MSVEKQQLLDFISKHTERDILTMLVHTPITGPLKEHALKEEWEVLPCDSPSEGKFGLSLFKKDYSESHTLEVMNPLLKEHTFEEEEVDPDSLARTYAYNLKQDRLISYIEDPKTRRIGIQVVGSKVVCNYWVRFSAFLPWRQS